MWAALTVKHAASIEQPDSKHRCSISVVLENKKEIDSNKIIAFDNPCSRESTYTACKWCNKQR